MNVVIDLLRHLSLGCKISFKMLQANFFPKWTYTWFRTDGMGSGIGMHNWGPTL